MRVYIIGIPSIDCSGFSTHDDSTKFAAFSTFTKTVDICSVVMGMR